ncbi:MED14-domain-containing protein [Obba rivulosa]|uniref:Mediator of RNA polymerase II transcription subunit 14 n=1 Tax=Obba rivulosa TaxID=1052685 RepID=A0A8E2DJC2_9APHY|nr:MED14-domain-containing protein [Obba rivulosa]
MSSIVANGAPSFDPLRDQPLTNGFHEPTVEELERELPIVQDGQVPLGELVSRVVQGIYAELSELAETMPNMSDMARKRTLADWVVQTKKQVVKLYAVVKWARDAEVVQKAMNVTAFLMDQNRQFEDAIHGLKYARDGLDPARLRNHDLLTALDVLTTGSYRRLPSCIKKAVIPPTPLTDEEVAKTLADIEDAMRYRLRMAEIVPVEMSRYRIDSGRVHFTVPRLFDVSLCAKGAQSNDGWFMVDVEFLFTVGCDQSGMQEFPRRPSGPLRRHILDEGDARLAFYLPLPADQQPPPGVEIPPRPQLPEGFVDAPLVRLYNFLQMMSLSYQLEILWFQGERLRSLGWADYLTVGMTNNRQTLTVAYWIRKPASDAGRPQPQNRVRLPLLGGTLTISIVPVQPRAGSKSSRSPKNRVLAELQQRAKLDTARPSDEVESFKLQVKWQPEKGALGVVIPVEDTALPESELQVNPDDLDLEALLRKVITKHTEGILKFFKNQLQHGPMRNVFSDPGEVELISEDGSHALKTHLCADEMVIVTLDPRTGRLNLRDTGDLAAAGRGSRFALLTQTLNENPTMLIHFLVTLKFSTITESVEQKAKYLGLQSYRIRNFPREELQKLGPARGTLYIQLSRFPNHYLVLVITDEGFRYALISVKVLRDTVHANMIMEDLGWLEVRRIQGDEPGIFPQNAAMEADESSIGQRRKRASDDIGGRSDSVQHYSPRFNLDTRTLRELYAYCCARVAYTKVENQLKLRGIPYSHVSASGGSGLPEVAHTQSSLARSIPALCVQSSDILSGAPAAEAAMPNIRVIPLHWWCDEQAQVVTCVKLKYVQQPVGKRAGSSGVIRPSKRIIYDAREAIVSFLSEDVDKCVDEFLEEWARVSKMVVIAREVAQMSQQKHWRDVRLLSFDLQTVEFAYAADYTVSITCTDQLSPSGGSYDLRFARAAEDDAMGFDADERLRHNPHEAVEPFLRNVLRHGRLAVSLHRLVALLRDTLPIVTELEDIRHSAAEADVPVDVLPKAAGWFRVLYGDLRHALDFRLMTGARIAVLDGSHSLFAPHADAAAAAPASGKPNSKTGSSAGGADSDAGLLLQPIPDMKAIVLEAVKAAAEKGARGQVAPIDVGVICDASAVRLVARALYEGALQRLKQVGSVK